MARRHWAVVLGVAVAAFLAINLFEPSYNRLQTAPSAAAFRLALDGPSRAVAATACDMVFAACYGLLGCAGLDVLARGRTVTRLATTVVVISAGLDMLENAVLTRNIVRAEHLTDGWIRLMRVPGTLKWIGSPVLLLILLAVVRDRASRRASEPLPRS